MPEEVVCLITGSRTWPDQRRGPIEMAMAGLDAMTNGNVRFLVGDCPTGVDAIALDIANKRNLNATIHVAKWTEYGRAAGPKRNGEMVAEALANKHSLAYAFRHEGVSDGTDNCIKQARQAGIPTYVVRNAFSEVSTADGTLTSTQGAS